MRENSYRLSRARAIDSKRGSKRLRRMRDCAQEELVPSVETTLPFLPSACHRPLAPLSLLSPSRPLSLTRAHAFVPSTPRSAGVTDACSRLVLSGVRWRAASPFRAPVPFDDLSLPPALFSSLSPDKRQHAALAQLPVVTSSALDAPGKSAVNTQRRVGVYSVCSLRPTTIVRR